MTLVPYGSTLHPSELPCLQSKDNPLRATGCAKMDRTPGIFCAAGRRRAVFGRGAARERCSRSCLARPSQGLAMLTIVPWATLV
jgi:hypothetical protein